MKSAEGKIGRVFILRLEDGDEVPSCIEGFAEENGVRVGYAVLVGGVAGGTVVSGPEDPDARPVQPMTVPVQATHEISAVGVLAPGDEGKPVLHIHGAMGREGKTITGCLRTGVKTWVVGEVVLYEILDTGAARVFDEATGFNLLQPGVRRPELGGETRSFARPDAVVEEPVAAAEHGRVIHLFNAHVN